MKILQLNEENVKRIQVVEIVPQGNTVVVGGLNANGKTSLLDGMAMAIGGKKLIPEVPVRQGADSGKVTMKLSAPPGRDSTPVIVTRTFSANGTTSLKITTEDGYEAPSPQALLESFTGAFTLDPVALLKAKPREQVDMARGIVGLDFTDMDKQRVKLYADRTIVNREVGKLAGAVKTSPKHDDAPEDPVSVAGLMERLEKVRAINSANSSIRDELRSSKANVDSLDGRMRQFSEQIASLQSQLANLQDAHDKAAASAAALESKVSTLVDQDEGPIKAEINGAEAINQKVADNAKRKRLAEELAAKRYESSQLTIAIDEIDAQKAKAMREAAWPVPGMGFDDNGLTLNGLPFSQASQAEQLEVSVAMGLAANPTLRVLLIRDGSLLDATTLASVAKIAERHDAQVWIERCSLGKECQVIITDGRVATDEEVLKLRGGELAAQQSLFSQEEHNAVQGSVPSGQVPAEQLS